jgi:hypothetical protein
MPRFSIFMAMAAVALVAANLAVIRAVVPVSEVSWPLFLVGLLPLLDAQIIGVYCLIVPRYRIWLRRRAPQERIGFAPTFAAVNALALLIAIATCVMAADAVMACLEYVGEALVPFVESMHLGQEFENLPIVQFVALPLFLGAILSGPPLLVTLTISWVSSRYKLVIVPRPRPALPATPHAAIPRETQSDDNTP